MNIDDDLEKADFLFQDFHVLFPVPVPVPVKT
jgi:hypothetical protein